MRPVSSSAAWIGDCLHGDLNECARVEGCNHSRRGLGRPARRRSRRGIEGPVIPGPIELIGVGGEGLEAQGLRSLFDFSELSIMGITQVLSKLPNLVRRIDRPQRRSLPRSRMSWSSSTARISPIASPSGRARRCPTCLSSIMYARASGRGRNTGRNACSLMSIMCLPCFRSNPRS
jgi:hypothetical protein